MLVRPRRLIVLTALALTLAGALPLARADDGDDLGKKVVDWAKAKIGKKVGQGQCSHLVVEALTAVGAKTNVDYGVTGLGKDYIWGTLVKDSKDAKPGDILQFRDVKLAEKVVVNCKPVIRNTIIPHHSAIVSVNLGKGKFMVLDQNRQGKQIVSENELDLGAKKEGTVWLYRPEKK
jgi:hypothetical protein